MCLLCVANDGHIDIETIQGDFMQSLSATAYVCMCVCMLSAWQSNAGAYMIAIQLTHVFIVLKVLNTL